jgi:hypothetical protein
MKHTKTYLRFRRIYDLLESNVDSSEKLTKIYEEMDSMYAFGSKQTATHALNAVNYIINEEQEQKNVEK